MYQPPHFREDDLGTQHALIRAYPLGMLITSGNSGLLANPVPFHLDGEASDKGVLRLHLARANSQWKDIRDGATVLAVFQGADSYVTPSWYQTKQETGKVVPTWNYAIVQAYGRMRVIDDQGGFVLTREAHLDCMEVQAELSPEAASFGAARREQIAHELAHAIKTHIGISAKITAVMPGAIERSVGKARRVMDRRPK